MKWNLLIILVLVLLLVSGCSPKPSNSTSPIPAQTQTATPAQSPITQSIKPIPPSSELPETSPTPSQTTTPAATDLAPTPETIPSSTVTPQAPIPIIDAHSQVCPEDLGKTTQLMDQAGVSCTILSAAMTSTAGIITPDELASFADKYPGRVIPAVRTKLGTGEKDKELLEKQVNLPQYRAIAEFLMYHDAELGKPQKSRQVIAHTNDTNFQLALQYALDKNWPFIMHIEFVAAGAQRDQFMTELEALLVKYPEHSFVLIHSQLDSENHRRLIESHNNIYFNMAGSNGNVEEATSNSPWTNMLDNGHFATGWKQLMIDHPDRFILGLDTVWPGQWGQFYLHEVATWREAIRDLPVDVAHAFAHGNAERLWHLPPLTSAP